MDKPKTYWLRFKGKANIPKPLNDEFGYGVIAKVVIDGYTSKPDYKGEDEITYAGMLIACEVCLPQGKKLIAQVKGSPSQKLRNMFYSEFDAQGGGDFQLFYEKGMGAITVHLPEVLQWLRENNYI